ncbi:MAG: hypothetical protein ABMA15_09125 [Vicinamibacterales bacterium]
MPTPALAVSVRGFGDTGWSATKTSGAPGNSSFALGQLDFFPTARISDEVSFLAEIVIEADQSNEPKVELERLLLRYAPLDSFAVSVGRYHTAIGYYNTAYHHSSLMQTTIGRPLLFAFEDEGGILPVHDVGVSISGSVTRLGARWEYTTEIGNGRASSPDGSEPVQGSLDDNAAKAVGFALSARPIRAKNASIGVSVRRDRLTPAGADAVRELLIGSSFVYQGSRVEFLAEGVVLRHARKGGETLTSKGGYIQASYRSGLLTPYARFEFIDPDDQDPYFAHASWKRGPLAGLRWDVANMAALKVEITRHRFVQGETANTVQANLSFGF